jgi:hypothetical protein
MSTNPDPSPEPKSELILYQTDDGGTRLDVRMRGEERGQTITFAAS